MNENNVKKKFGLPTAISMIVGIVVGSGIFFKTDDILINTNGSVLLGAIALIIGAVGIVFGGLTLAKLSENTDTAGGIITYCELAYGKLFAFLAGFFQMGIYFPSLIALLMFVAANYTLLLFPEWNLNIWGITVIYFVVFFSINYFATKLAGAFQTLSTIIKLIPLLLIGIIGLVFGDPSTVFQEHVGFSAFVASSTAIISVAFSYDGWTIAPTIAHEIRNAKRNLSFALSISPLIIMVVYLVYFIGMSSVLGPDEIIALGDAHVSKVTTMYFGGFGNKVILLTIVISVLGTVNGLTLGGMRVPYSLALRKELPHSEKIAHINPRTQVPGVSSIICMLLSAVWLFIHYLSTKIDAFKTLDISSIPIVIMYIIYLSLFISVIIKYVKKEITSFFRGIVCPVLACLGALIVLWGALTSAMALIYIIISFLVIIIGVIMYKVYAMK